jgi:chromosome segregation ATPase
MTVADIVTIITAIGGILLAGIGAYVRARFDARLVALETERDALRKSLEGQTKTIAEQSDRLTTTINALTKVTLERDALVKQVELLTQERDALERERDTLVRRLIELTAGARARTEGERGE